MDLIRAVKGMNDLFPDELALWQQIENTAREVFKNFGFGEIRTPILENLKLFVRSVGEGTDIVEKEMYTLTDKDDSLLCLRPENTASVVRALIEKKFFVQESEFKTYYIGPMFRRERPQKGRLRQFHQIGAEVFGIADPSADVELISMLHLYFTKLGVSNLKLNLNSLGEASERQIYVKQLTEFFASFEGELCHECTIRLKKNPLRLLDCKNPKCIEIGRAAPTIIQFLTSDSLRHFEAVQDGLTKLNIDFEIAPRLVRGLDYYSRTVFELNAMTGLGSQNAVGAGGRYDTLCENLGGPKTPALGFALGIERIAILLADLKIEAQKDVPQLTIAYTDQESKAFTQLLANQLRQHNVFVDYDHKERSLKAQMRRADKIGSKTIIVLGESERESYKGQLKSLVTGATQSVSLDAQAIILALQHPE